MDSNKNVLIGILKIVRTTISDKKSEAKEIIIVLMDMRMDIRAEIMQRGAPKKKLRKELEIDGVHQESFNRCFHFRNTTNKTQNPGNHI